MTSTFFVGDRVVVGFDGFSVGFRGELVVVVGFLVAPFIVFGFLVVEVGTLVFLWTTGFTVVAGCNSVGFWLDMGFLTVEGLLVFGFTVTKSVAVAEVRGGRSVENPTGFNGFPVVFGFSVVDLVITH